MLRLMQHPGRHAAAVRGREQISGLVSGIPVTINPTTTATTLRPGEGGLLVTDGPLIEGPEHVGGFSIIDVPGLDSALAWGRTLVGASTIPIEVRPFYDGAG